MTAAEDPQTAEEPAVELTVDLAAAADTSTLPYVSDGEEPPIAAEIRVEVEDFRVSEIPAYSPSGEGDHLFVRFEKRALDTVEAVRRIARALGVDARGAGWAGLKDRHAITEQWASFEHADAARLDAEIEGVTILESARHNNKLRTGHLHGNRFDLLLRGADPSGLDATRALLQELQTRGLPAYFGPQRFGREGRNLPDAARWLMQGGRAPQKRFRRKLLVSSLQSAIFNELLAERVREGTLGSVIEGDLLQKVDSGGLFVSEDRARDAERASAFEVSATGPMFGAKMRWPEGEALAREERALARWGLTRDALRRFKKAGSGTRRRYRFKLDDVQLDPVEHGLRLRFTLPAGAYATVVLREVLRREVR